MKSIEDLILEQLEEPVKLADGKIALKEDGTPMTKQEAIAMNLINKAMRGDIQAIQYIETQKKLVTTIKRRKK